MAKGKKQAKQRSPDYYLKESRSLQVMAWCFLALMFGVLATFDSLNYAQLHLPANSMTRVIAGQVIVGPFSYGLYRCCAYLGKLSLKKWPFFLAALLILVGGVAAILWLYPLITNAEQLSRIGAKGITNATPSFLAGFMFGHFMKSSGINARMAHLVAVKNELDERIRELEARRGATV
jgi:hypothetical protein